MPKAKVISEEVRRKIAAEPVTVSYVQIASRYGVSWHHVKSIRMQAGVHTSHAEKKAAGSAIQVFGAEAIEIVAPAGTQFDRAIEAIDEQIALYENTRSVLQALKDAL